MNNDLFLPTMCIGIILGILFSLAAAQMFYEIPCEKKHNVYDCEMTYLPAEQHQ